MNALELFERLEPLVAPMLEAEWGRKDLCVLATASVIEVARYFDIEVQPLPVQVFLYNTPFREHLRAMKNGRWEGPPAAQLTDGSWSVGIGMTNDPDMPGRWNGHLIAACGQTFGDFSIRQAERLDRSIVTGPAIVGPITGQAWRCENRYGTTVEYRLSHDEGYRRGPDWRDKQRRRRTVGQLIRAVR